MTGEAGPTFAGLEEIFAATEDPAAARAFWGEATGGKSAPNTALERQLAEDILALRGQYPAEMLRQFRGSMLSTAASTLRGKATDRPGNGPKAAGTRLVSRRQSHRGFFALDEVTLNHDLFAGGESTRLKREVFLASDAVTVLPYDPARDLVLLVEQFRPAPLLRGEPRPWQVEAIAGRIDPEETPVEAARREALEEAGIDLGALIPVADYYPSPGAMSEYLYSYVALADLSQVKAGLFGLPEEGEDIRTHILPIAEALDWIAQGRIANGPLVLTLYWLMANRGTLAPPA